jgi:DNA topoisomerase-1
VTVGSGRYGPYVRHGKLFASIPRDTDPAEVTLEQAVQLLEAQAAKAKDGGKAPRARSRAAGKPKAESGGSAKAKAKSASSARGRRRSASGD